MAVHLPPYPPFGFSVWYDRHHGKQWCWRDRRPPGDPQDIVEGSGFDTKTAAVFAVREELRARKQRASATE